MLRLVKFSKDLLLLIPVTLIFAPLHKFFLFIVHFNRLIIWIRKSKKGLLYCDFFSPVRDYDKRYKLYKVVSDHYHLNSEEVTYLEFGVAAATSFKWWLKENSHVDSKFYGFDTFEGLPEDWGGFYAKGDMSYDITALDDTRGRFIKGLFQDTLVKFIEEEKNHLQLPKRKIIHMDADLYSATIFTLSQLYPYLHDGDIIFFDEFNVAMHEFKAFTEYTSNFYATLQPVAAVNNFYQTAFIVKK